MQVAQSSFINVTSATVQEMQQFIGLVILKAEVMGYSYVYFIAAIVMLVGSFTAFLIKIPNEISRTQSIVTERAEIESIK